MATNATSLKIPEQLKARIEAAAEAVGKSPRAFMLEAIEDGTARVESRREFVDRAVRARENFSKRRMGYAAADVHRYMTQLAQGIKAKKPGLKRWPKVVCSQDPGSPWRTSIES